MVKAAAAATAGYCRAKLQKNKKEKTPATKH
jgi:hypothetical protein